MCDRLVLDVATGQPNLFILQRREIGIAAEQDRCSGAMVGLLGDIAAKHPWVRVIDYRLHSLMFREGKGDGN